MEPVLSPEVSEKYDLNTLQPGEYLVQGYGKIDLCTMSVAIADGLVANGFLYLTLKAAPTPAPDTTVKTKAAPKAVTPDPNGDDSAGTGTGNDNAPTP